VGVARLKEKRQRMTHIMNELFVDGASVIHKNPSLPVEPIGPAPER
jgi:hypothetical protein